MAIEHKPLIDYLPPFLAEYREYRYLFDALWGEISENDQSILDRIESALNDTFIASVDCPLSPSASLSLDRWSLAWQELPPSTTN